MGNLGWRFASQETEHDVGERRGERRGAYPMDRASQFLILGAIADVLTCISNQIVYPEVSTLVPELSAPGSTEKIAKDCRDVRVRTLGIDAMDRPRDSE